MAIIYKEEFETRLQERLDAPMKWKEICRVEYTDSRVLHNPYLTDSTVGTGTRGSAYTSTAVATVDDTFTINTYAANDYTIGNQSLIDSYTITKK